MNTVKERRLGYFFVDRKTFESDEFVNNFWQLRFIPTKVEFSYASNTIDMVGYSPLFGENPPECVAPHYDIIVERRAGRDIKLRAVRYGS